MLKTVGKTENAGKQHFLPFQQCFLPIPTQIAVFVSHLFCSLQILFDLDMAKILSSCFSIIIPLQNKCA